MSEQEYAWMLGAISAWQHQLDHDQDGQPSFEMKKVTGVSGLLRDYRQEAENEMVAALILVLIYAWNCAKYRARIGGPDQNCAKYSQNVAALFFGIQFALALAIRAFHETRGQFSDPAPECQMNSSPSHMRLA